MNRWGLGLLLAALITIAAGPVAAQTTPRPSEPTMTLARVAEGAVGPFENFCDGYGNPGTSGVGYVSVLKLETGLVKSDMDEILDGIVAYDRAETTGTYLGQINMITASSFNGVNGAVWGYHLAAADELAGQAPLFEAKGPDGKPIPVYSMEPLLRAGRALFGTIDQPRFPPLPGAHVVCAVKSKTIKGPGTVWCAAALAIAEDRTAAANLFIEDVGGGVLAQGPAMKQFIDRLRQKIVSSVLRCGEDSRVKFTKVFIGHRIKAVPAGYTGTALTCAPYVVLARKAVPAGGPAELVDLTLSQWEKILGLKPLKP